MCYIFAPVPWWGSPPEKLSERKSSPRNKKFYRRHFRENVFCSSNRNLLLGCFRLYFQLRHTWIWRTTIGNYTLEIQTWYRESERKVFMGKQTTTMWRKFEGRVGWKFMTMRNEKVRKVCCFFSRLMAKGFMAINNYWRGNISVRGKEGWFICWVTLWVNRGMQKTSQRCFPVTQHAHDPWQHQIQITAKPSSVNMLHKHLFSVRYSFCHRNVA